MPTEKPMTVKAVADQCHASKVSVLRWIRQGELRAYQTPGGHHRILREDFEAFASRYGFPVDVERHFLIADDDPAARGLIRRVLEKEFPGCRIDVAEDGYEAFYLIGKVRPRLVILDVRMPQIDGVEVCRKIRTHPSLKDIRILVVTGFSHEYPREKILEAGADAYLEKPFDISALAEEIRKLL